MTETESETEGEASLVMEVVEVEVVDGSRGAAGRSGEVFGGGNGENSDNGYPYEEGPNRMQCFLKLIH